MHVACAHCCSPVHIAPEAGRTRAFRLDRATGGRVPRRTHCTIAALLLALALGSSAGVLAQQPAAEVRTDRDGVPLPTGALARFGTTRLRQGWMASRVRFAP